MKDETFALQKRILNEATTNPNSITSTGLHQEDTEEVGNPLYALFPFNLKYVDLTSLKKCDRVPALVYYRSEFDVLDTLLTNIFERDTTNDHIRTRRIIFLTGTPGIGMIYFLFYFSNLYPLSGKTVAIYVKIANYMKGGREFLFQDHLGHLYHVAGTISVIPTEADGNYHLKFPTVTEAFVDLDNRGSIVRQLVPTLLAWPNISIIIATSPHPTLHSSWLSQETETPDVLVMNNWTSPEFWITR
jgi:hypothetical protein